MKPFSRYSVSKLVHTHTQRGTRRKWFYTPMESIKLDKQ